MQTLCQVEMKRSVCVCVCKSDKDKGSTVYFTTSDLLHNCQVSVNSLLPSCPVKMFPGICGCDLGVCAVF